MYWNVSVVCYLPYVPCYYFCWRCAGGAVGDLGATDSRICTVLNTFTGECALFCVMTMSNRMFLCSPTSTCSLCTNIYTRTCKFYLIFIICPVFGIVSFAHCIFHSTYWCVLFRICFANVESALFYSCFVCNLCMWYLGFFLVLLYCIWILVIHTCEFVHASSVIFIGFGCCISVYLLR
jgi:hypothetical protein